MNKTGDDKADAAKRLAVLRPYIDGEASLTKGAAGRHLPSRRPALPAALR
ncbi:MAG: hypothetical protein AB7T14_10120 [Candidatus Methylacidiphilaceae bacterium]